MSRKWLGQQRRQGVTENGWTATEARCHGRGGCFWWGCGGRVRWGFLSYYTYRPGGGGLRVLPRCKRFGAFGGLDDTPASCRAGGVGDGPAPPWVMCPPGSRRPGEAEGGPAPHIVHLPPRRGRAGRSAPVQALWCLRSRLDDTPASCRAGGVGDGPAPPWVMCPPGSRRPGEAEGGPAPPIVVYPKAVPVGVKVWSASWPSRLQGRTSPHGTSNNIVLLP